MILTRIWPFNCKKMRKEDLPPTGMPRDVTLAEFNKLQKEHLLKHKYYLSEKRGNEVSEQEAAEDWTKNGWAQVFRNCFHVVSRDGETVTDYEEGYEE